MKKANHKMGMKFRRKLQGVSKYSRYVSIPVYWLYANELKTGDELEIELKGNGTLVIRPVGKEPVNIYQAGGKP